MERNLDIALKEKGNEYFGKKQFEQASKCYTQAIMENKKIKNVSAYKEKAYNCAVYYSNRSNCLFELGKYDEAIADAHEVIKHVDDAMHDKIGDDMRKMFMTLKWKNQLRLAKIFFYARQSLTEVEFALHQLANCNDKTLMKSRDAWLKRIEFYKNVKASPMEAISNEQNLPILRASLRGQINEMFVYGHDNPQSAFGSGGDFLRPMNLKLLSSEERAQISVLFGGVGDARHVFATILDAYSQLHELPQEKRKTFRIHFTMNDVVPAVIARDLLIFITLSKLGAFDSYMCIRNDKEAGKWATLLEYLYLGVVMPANVHDNLVNLMDYILSFDFESFTSSFPWMCFSSKSQWNEVVKTIHFWYEGKTDWGYELPSVDEMLREFNHKVPSDVDFAALGARNGLDLSMLERAKKEQEEQEAAEMDEVTRQATLEYARLKELSKTPINQWEDGPLKKMADELSTRLSPDTMRATDEEIVQKLQIIIRGLAGLNEDGTRSPDLYPGYSYKEGSFLRETHVVLPPKNSADKSPLKGVFEKAHFARGPNKDQYEEARKIIDDEWKTNPVVIDPSWLAMNGGAAPYMNFDPISGFMNQFYMNDEVEDLLLEDEGEKTEFFDYFATFFWNVGSALTSLVNDEILYLELSVGGLTCFCRDILTTSELRDKRTWPCKFQRIFVSNIPDYIGMLPFVTEVMPLMHNTDESYLMSNVMMNTGIWKNYSHYVFSATAIPQLKEVSPLLGYQPVGKDCVWGEQQWVASPNAKHVSRDELTLWLHRLYLSIMFPSQRDSFCVMREECPYSINMFFRVCTHLVEYRNYPSHWIAGVLDEILASSKNFTTSALISTNTPKTFKREDKICTYNLSSFLLEFKTHLRMWLQSKANGWLLPFNTRGLPSFVRKYSLSRRFLMISNVFTQSFYAKGNCLSNSLGFILSKESKRVNHRLDMLSAMMRRLPGLDMPLASQDSLLRDEIMERGADMHHVFTCMEWSVSFTKNAYPDESSEPKQIQTVSFWMDDRIFKELSAYSFNLIRTDSWEMLAMFSKPCLRDFECIC